MQTHFSLSDPLSGRALKTANTDLSKTTSALQAESNAPVQRKNTAIEIGNLPMVRKGGGTAILFDRMDSNGNGVLTRSELISYRLAPLVTETTLKASPMPEETMRQIGQAAKALLDEGTHVGSKDQTTGTFKDAASGSLEAAFGISDAPSTPSSLPESVVMAQAAAPAPSPSMPSAPELAFA